MYIHQRHIRLVGRNRRKFENMGGNIRENTMDTKTIIVTLVTDRTQADVERVRELAAKGFAAMTADEQAEWLAGMKGTYNASDMNRVGTALNYLAARLSSICGRSIAWTAKTDWAVTDIPAASQAETYRRQIQDIRDALVNPAGTPDVPQLARELGNTRSAVALEHWREHLEGSVVVIGNAPTALFYLLEMLDAGAPRPALILGMPVGFIGAAESKDMLAADSRGVPYVIVRGRRGGSAMAAAAVNALATEVE